MISPHSFRATLFSILAAFLSCQIGLAQSQAEMNEDAAADFAAVDERLNAVYEALMKKKADDAFVKNAIREAQRAWLKYVDLHMASYLPVPEGESPRVLYGSMYPIEFYGEKSRLFEQRIELLQKFDTYPD